MIRNHSERLVKGSPQKKDMSMFEPVDGDTALPDLLLSLMQNTDCALGSEYKGHWETLGFQISSWWTRCKNSLLGRKYSMMKHGKAWFIIIYAFEKCNFIYDWKLCPNIKKEK